ncbi:MAG TPA: queuosine salvage family protein [Candidatus Acidoferrales bacterium]|nr:queuosine salvage family protein [Candidatus Acidoferrales bacterium]
MGHFTMYWPKSIGSPVLDSVRYAVESSRGVQTHYDKIVEVASWMAYEELPMPEFTLPFGVGQKDADEAIDFVMVADSIDTAFTDFTRHEKFQVDYAGQHWSDSDAEFACIKRAVDNGVPFLDGGYLAKITRADLNKVFEGNIEMPMLDEKLEVLHQVGSVLAEKYDGRFHNFVKSCSPKLYDNGNGLIDRLVKEFPRFNDVSMLDGHEIKFYKLAQLGVWMLYATLHEQGKFRLDDPQKMTAFADYIVPLALRLHGITSYSEKLEKAINSHELIPRDSRWEIEIRAHCIYATAVLTEEINKRRPANLQVIIPQIDARFWTHFHTTTWPHHLTRTIMY